MRSLYPPSGALALGLCAALLWSAPVLAQDAPAPAQDAPAHAQDDSPASELTAPTLDSTALALFDASVAFQEGRYQRSVEHFRRAHALSGRPELLYRIGSAADRAGMHEVALDAYRRYLAEVPESALHDRARQRLAILEAQRARDPRAIETPQRRASGPHAAEPPAPSLASNQEQPTRATPERASAEPSAPLHAPRAADPGEHDAAAHTGPAGRT